MDTRGLYRFGVALLRTPAVVLPALLAGASALLFAPAAHAQAYPSKPVRIIVPAAPAGGVDLVARALADELGKRLGQPVLVENKPGGATNIGSDFVAKSPPDGYTLLMASPANAVNMSLFQKMPYDTRRDLVPVVLAGSMPSVMLVNTELPARTTAEFVAAAKARPGGLNYAAGGNGTSEHLAAEMFKGSAGIDFKGVMYKGGAPALNDVIGGHVQFMFTNLLAGLPQIRAGKVRALGITDTQRSSALPDVPTFAEAGYPDMQVAVWWGVMAPAGTPPAVVARLNREAVASVNSPEFRKFLEGMGGRVSAGTPEEFGRFLDGEIARWAKVVQAAGITPQ